MTAEESLLLAQIAAQPEDDAPRLALADLLAARGDPRGELIRVQCEAGRSANTPARQARARELLEPNERAWTEAAGIRGAITFFRRGFPVLLAGSSAEIVACREALRTQPITELSISSGFDRLAEILALPGLARVRTLELGSSDSARLDAGALEAFASSPHLTGLRELVLRPGALDDRGASALAGASWLGAIEKLVLARNRVSPPAMGQILSRLVAVRWLVLEGCDLHGDGLQGLLRSPARQLDGLLLASTELEEDDAVRLARSPLLATVTRLELARNGIHDTGATELAGSPSVGQLRKLDLRSNMLEDGAAQALAGSTALASLEELDLRENLITLRGVLELARGSGLPALKRLGITANDLSTGAWRAHEAESWGEFAPPAGSTPVQMSREQLAEKFASRVGWLIE